MFDTNTVNTIKEVANQYSIPEAALLAVVSVESAGVPFWTVAGVPKPPIRFEGHYFYRLLAGNRMRQEAAVKAGLASPKAGAIANPTSYTARYALLERAALIDKAAAYMSTSWGLGQVMGEHWGELGYKSIDDMVNAANSLGGQVDMMARFIANFGLSDELDRGDFKGFAEGYNGKGQKGYDKKLEAAYNSFKDGTVDNAAKDATIQLQTMLNKVLGTTLALDGDMGDGTKAAIRDFQIKNMLKVDGLYGPLTKEVLEAKYRSASVNSGLQTGGSVLAGGTIGTTITEAAKQIEPLSKTSQILQFVFVGLILLGVILAIRPYLFPNKV